MTGLVCFSHGIRCVNLINEEKVMNIYTVHVFHCMLSICALVGSKLILYVSSGGYCYLPCIFRSLRSYDPYTCSTSRNWSH